MRRPQFSLKTMLWLMAVAGAFFAGIEWDRRHPDDHRRALWENLQECREQQGETFDLLMKMRAAMSRHGIDPAEVEKIDLKE
ncbi:MAG TPA: hypothetical protein VG826_20755 [Pirellulales bacterium]|nr:hypothetical protein [Pirellulales bacterium]